MYYVRLHYFMGFLMHFILFLGHCKKISSTKWVFLLSREYTLTQKFTKWTLKIDNYLEDLGFLDGGWGVDLR